MILLLVYYYKLNYSDQEIQEINADVNWDNNDELGYTFSEHIKDDLYNLKLLIIAKYFGNHFIKDAQENIEKYELMFDDFFEYNFWTIAR